MKRITPEEVVQAYERTGLKPCFSQWSDEGQGCGLHALGMALGKGSLNGSFQAAVALDLSSWYVLGFITGFDNGSKWWGTESEGRIMMDGYVDGQKARKAVLAYVEQGVASTVQLAAEALSVAPVPSNEAVAS